MTENKPCPIPKAIWREWQGNPYTFAHKKQGFCWLQKLITFAFKQPPVLLMKPFHWTPPSSSAAMAKSSRRMR